MSTDKVTLDDPNMSLFIYSRGKLFTVTAICDGVAEANAYCEETAGESVIAEDRQGRVYVAEDYTARKVKL